MKMLIDLGEIKPQKGDMLRFDGERWVPISETEAFDNERLRLSKLEEDMAILRKEVDEFESGVGKKVSVLAKAVEDIL